MIKLAVIGTGAWGRNHARTFNALGVLWGIADASEQRRKEQAALYPQARILEDIDAVIECGEVDAVVIATPAVNHFELCEKALEAGLHAFVEKPITLKVKDALRLAELSESSGKIVMVGHLMLYHPGVAVMKELVDSGELGEALYLYGQRVNLGRVRSDENAMWSLAPHDISIALHLFGQVPVQVSAVGSCYIQNDRGIQDVVFLNMLFEDGKMANVHLSWLDPHKVRKITLVGSKKMVTFDDTAATEKIRIFDKGVRGFTPGEYDSYGDLITLRTGDIVIPRIDMSEPLKLQAQHFIDCIEQNKTPLSDVHNGIAVLKVLSAASRSLEAGGAPIRLDEE